MHSATPLVVLQQPVQRRAPLIREYEAPGRTGDKILLNQGGYGPVVGPFGMRLDVEKHRAFRGWETVRCRRFRTCAAHLVCHWGSFSPNPRPPVGIVSVPN